MNLRTLIVLLVALVCSSAVHAQERILSFHSDIRVQADASMLVTETIRVRAEGRNIRRGIYREFPNRYRDRYGNRVVVDFEVLSLSRDGQPEMFSTESRYNGVRVDFGGEALLAVPAEYEYVLRYRTDRQIGYFDDHDELYWNVTGTGWAFTIEQASALVQLPQQVPAADIHMEGYTGPQGSQAQDYTVTIDNGQAAISSTVSLPSRSGLTLAMSWPKGVVRQPETAERLRHLLSDNLGLLLALATLLASLAWLLLAWHRVGRDPQPGVIFPQYEPPAGCSPAAARFVMRMGYDYKAFTAAVVNLAVKGRVLITEDDKTFSLQQLQSTQSLSPGEDVLLQKLFGAAGTLELSNDNHARISAARKLHAEVLGKEYRQSHFALNGRYLLPSALGSLLMLGLILLLGAFVPLLLLVYLVNLVVHLIFIWLLRAPSDQGRALMDRLEGFRMYLEVAEKDDLNAAHPPQLTPELFERYLPYAIALDVEQEWAERFAQVFEDLESTQGHSYHPVWYVGTFSALRMGEFSRSVGSSMTSAISSSAMAPGTASGVGGGGFSGGGGGGGGGGGR